MNELMKSAGGREMLERDEGETSRDRIIRCHMDISANRAKTSATEGGDVEMCEERAEGRTNHHVVETASSYRPAIQTQLPPTHRAKTLPIRFQNARTPLNLPPPLSFLFLPAPPGHESVPTTIQNAPTLKTAPSSKGHQLIPKTFSKCTHHKNSTLQAPRPPKCAHPKTQPASPLKCSKHDAHLHQHLSSPQPTCSPANQHVPTTAPKRHQNAPQVANISKNDSKLHPRQRPDQLFLAPNAVRWSFSGHTDRVTLAAAPHMLMERRTSPVEAVRRQEQYLGML